jgi:hypothetical protein
MSFKPCSEISEKKKRMCFDVNNSKFRFAEVSGYILKIWKGWDCVHPISLRPTQTTLIFTTKIWKNESKKKKNKLDVV